MNDLQLIKSENFGAVECDFYRKDDDICMTREQIGAALEYGSPRKAIEKLHLSHKERLDKFSTIMLLPTPVAGGGARNTTLYNRKGIMEICRWSQQPKADAFMDWAWDVIDGLMSKGSTLVSAKQLSPNELILKMAQSNVDMELRVNQLEESSTALADKVDKALMVFSRPDKDHWKADMDEAIKDIVKQNSLSEIWLRGKLYAELEQKSNCFLQSRLSRMRLRMKKQGATRREWTALNKLDVISKDTKLKAIFEGVVKKYQIRYAQKAC